MRKPTKIQRQILLSRAKRKVVRGGRRGGKTVCAALQALEAFGKGRRVLYAVPTIEQSDAFWREVSTALEERIRAGVYRKSEGERVIEVPSSTARIKAKTAWDADSLRGDYADLLILDEAQLMNESAWEYVGLPMLLDNDGDALLIYTPPSFHDRVLSKASDRRWMPKLFAKASKDDSGRWQAFHFASHDNEHLSREALAEAARDMSVLAYKQEILALDVEQIPGALWSQRLVDRTRVSPNDLPPLTRIVVAIDPSGSATTECGITAVGANRDGHRYVLRDVSLAAPSPETWAAAAVKLYHELKADRIVGERNYGGDMVQAVLRTVDANVSYKDVVATRGKVVRAEPIAASFERGRAHLVGQFPELEAELCSYVPGNPSPNRLDAMVWGMTELGDSEPFGVIELLKQLAAGLHRALLSEKETVQPVAVAQPGTQSEAPTPPPLTDEKRTCSQCNGEMRARQNNVDFFVCQSCGAAELISRHVAGHQSRAEWLASNAHRGIGRGSFGRFGEPGSGGWRRR